MKAKFDYKSKKILIVVAIAVLLLIVAVIGTVAFINGNNDAAAAMKEGNAQVDTDEKNNGGNNNESSIENKSGGTNKVEVEIPEINENAGNNETTNNETSDYETANNENETANNTEDNGITNSVTTQGTTSNGAIGSTTSTTTGTANNGTTTGTTNSNVPSQEYIQETIIQGEDKKVEETTKIGWEPVGVKALIATTKLGINKATLENSKIVFVNADENLDILHDTPVNTAAQKGDVLTYVIKVHNTSKMDATNIRVLDTIPEGTEYVENSVIGDGTITGENLTWKVSVPAEETIAVSFKVKVIAEQINLIENKAIVDGQQDDNTITNTPIITNVKSAMVVETNQDGVETLVDRDAKVGEKIRYTITLTNPTDYDGITQVSDKAPEGTTLVENSITNGGAIAEDGTITWENIKAIANSDTTVSFDVIVNKEILNKETNQMEPVQSVKNTATVGGQETNEEVTEVANITTTKASVGTHADGTPATTENPLHELDTITYTLTATNSGNGTGTVTISDVIPVGTTLVGDVTVTGDTTKYDVKYLENGIAVDVEVKPSGETKVTFTVKINVFKLGDANVTEENGKTIRTIDNLVAAQDGETIETGTSDKVEKEYTSVTATKIWDDEPISCIDEKGPRPSESITIVLKGGENVIEKQLSGTGNTWTDTFELPKYDSNGKPITYTVDEKEVPDWYVKSSVDTTTNTITNSIPRLEVTKNVTNIYDKDGNDTERTRVEAGDIIEYTIIVKNTGNISLNNVTLTDSMTNGKIVYKEYDKDTKTLSAPISNNIVESGVQIGISNSKVFYVYYKVDDEDVKYAKDAEGKEITIDNIVTATENYIDGKGANRVVESNDQESVGIKCFETITIKKEQEINGVKLDSVGKNSKGEQVSVIPNSKIEYTITIENTGNTIQKNVVVTDIMNNMPDGNTRNVTIKSVKINGESRAYTFDNGVLKLYGNLDVDETAIIKAEYIVGTCDMTTSVGSIQNKASVKTDTNPDDPTKPIEDVVEVPTEAWGSNIMVSKSGKLSDGTTDANGNTAEYGSKITYTLSATNSGNAAGTKVLKDIDLSTLLESKKISNVEAIEVNDFDPNGNPRTNTTKTIAELISGIEVNVPAGETAFVTFTITVTASPDSENPISNSVEGGTTPVVTPVVKTINVKSNTGKVSGANYVLIIDASKSMTGNKVSGGLTRFEAAKGAISDLATFLFKEDSETTSKLSIVQFHKTANIVSVGNQIVFGVKDYNNGNITKLINNITTSSRTNIQAGLEKAGDLLYGTDGIHAKGLTTNKKDVIILLSDGEPNEGATSASKLGTIATTQLNRKGEGIINDIYSIAFGKDVSTNTLQAISPKKVYSSTNKEDLFKTFKDIVYEAGDATPVILTKKSQVIYTGDKELAEDKEITITYDGLTTPLKYTFTAPGTSEDGVLTYKEKDGTYSLTFNLTEKLLDKENILITYYVK